MKKLNVVMNVLLCSSSFVCAMDIVQRRVIKTGKDVAFTPLSEIRVSHAALSQKQQKKIEQQLSQSWTFNVALLPTEVKKQIIVKMFDGDDQAARLFYSIPITHAFYSYDQKTPLPS